MSICNIRQKFKGVHSINQDLLLNNLESNFKMFLDWSFLHIGSWFNVKLDEYKIYNPSANSLSKLVLAEDPSYTNGAVWQGLRKDWVWETGVFCNDLSPLNISGVYIDDNFYNYPSNDYHINYPLGRIVFNEPISTSANVELEYSYRYVQVYRGSESPWTQILQFNSLQNNNKDISKTDSGFWSIGSNHRIQMPCIVIESVPRARSSPYELGNDNLIIEQDIDFYIFAESKNERNKLLDILRLQQDSTILLFDTNNLAENEQYPLNYLGDVISEPLNYEEIIFAYPWRKCWLKTCNLYEMDSIHPELFQGAIRFTCEIISE